MKFITNDEYIRKLVSLENCLNYEFEVIFIMTFPILGSFLKFLPPKYQPSPNYSNIEGFWNRSTNDEHIDHFGKHDISLHIFLLHISSPNSVTKYDI